MLSRFCPAVFASVEHTPQCPFRVARARRSKQQNMCYPSWSCTHSTSGRHVTRRSNKRCYLAALHLLGRFTSGGRGRMMGSLPCGHAIGRASCSEQLSGHQARRKGQAERCTLQPCWLVVCASTGAFGVSYVVEVSERGKRRREGGCLGGRLPRANEAWGCCLRMARHRWWEQTRASHERVGQAARQSGNPAVR